MIEHNSITKEVPKTKEVKGNWKIISLGKQGQTRIYDPYNKDVSDRVISIRINMDGPTPPKVWIELSRTEIDIQAYEENVVHSKIN